MQSEWTRPAWSGPGCRWSFRSIASGAPNLLHSIHKRGHRKSQNANEARCSDEAQLCLQSGCDKKGLELSTFRDQITAQSFRWGTMARYFFHVIGADGAFKDAEGLSFPALEDAMAYAAGHRRRAFGRGRELSGLRGLCGRRGGQGSGEGADCGRPRLRGQLRSGAPTINRIGIS
jgi:hypothetical protein